MQLTINCNLNIDWPDVEITPHAIQSTIQSLDLTFFLAIFTAAPAAPEVGAGTVAKLELDGNV